MSINDICKQRRIKITLKLWSNDGTVKIYHPPTIRRFLSTAKANKWEKAYVRVVYGKGVTNSGKIEQIYNDGTYFSLPELKDAFLAFTEKSLLEDTARWVNSS